MDACTNPDILRVIWFFLMLIDIVKIIIPIALIVLGIVDFSKAAITNDEKVQQKSGKLFGKRLLYAVLVFTIPWLVEVLMVTLGNLIGESGQVNFTDCIENANGEMIEQLESNDCGDGEVVVINYYDGENKKIDSVLACSNKAVKFNRIVKKGACINSGWKFKNTNYQFSNGEKYNLAPMYDDIKAAGRFDLVPIWSGVSFTIDYYSEDGKTLYKSEDACTGVAHRIEGYFKEGYYTSWKLEYPINHGISGFETATHYTFSEDEIKENNIKMTAEIEKITLENCRDKKHKITFFDETGQNVINSIEFCEYQLITFPSYDVQGRVFKGWDFKYNSNGMPVYTAGEKRTFQSAQLWANIYQPHDSFHLIPVFE